jgi:hypothetical protein
MVCCFANSFILPAWVFVLKILMLTIYCTSSKIFQRTVCCYTNVHPYVTRVDCGKTKQHAKVIITPQGNCFFFQLDRSLRLPLSDAVFDAKFPVSGKTPTEKHVRRIHFRPQRLNGTVNTKLYHEVSSEINPKPVLRL